ncbi:acetate kinase [Azoarcus sp. L1K30]|uniref:acetate kinase n=1 Tax=Azoarcus sp. L1K30 TaxID=2820277 RepID=UPI00201386D4|nr:acetate kinase [Azoarcus sp. L1K30]
MKFKPTRIVQALGQGFAGCVMLAAPGLAMAADAADPDMAQMRQQIDAQNAQIDVLKANLARQEAALAELKRSLGISEVRGRGVDAPAGGKEQPVVVAQQGNPQKPVGQAPDPARDTRSREMATIFETPGVLTAPGKYVLEPSLQYAYSSSNRIALVGYTVIPAILIGLIDVREVKRNTFTAALTVRRGITNRFELEAKVPWVYRSDTSISREIAEGSSVDSVFDADGSNLGDVEITGRYQLNDGGGDSPYYIASLRLKTRTGKDPFEVRTNYTLPGGRGTGLQSELPTGSGFYTLTPGLTVLMPSDPAVFFGGVSYQHSFKRDNVKANTDGGDVLIGEVAPGGVIGFNFGMGLALNDRSSFSIGYDHQSVGKVKINGKTAAGSVTVQLGSLLLGYSHRLNSGNTVNLSLGVGVTSDTPDLQLTLRMPMTL